MFSIDTLKIGFYNVDIRSKKEDKKMTLEVYKDGLVVGFVKANDILSAYKIVREFFPDCSNVRTGHLPTSDVRCVKVNDNVYTWNLIK